MRYVWLGMFVVVMAALLAACATQPAPTAHDPPGFLIGLVHGLISPLSLIAELFTNVRVYAFLNSGGWYDFGFMLGVGALGGDGSRIA